MEQQNPSTFFAAVVSHDKNSILPNSIIVPDHKLYFASFDNADEAHYLCGFLNSMPVRTWLGGFLLGKQIGTTIFQYMNLPIYNTNIPECVEIAKISKSAHKIRLGSRDKNYLDIETEKALSHFVQTLCIKLKK